MQQTVRVVLKLLAYVYSTAQQPVFNTVALKRHQPVRDSHNTLPAMSQLPMPADK